MRFKAPAAAGAVLITGALAFPVGAAAHLETGVSSVRAHTDRADAALDRAVALFEKNSDNRQAEQAFDGSRREMAQATVEAARLRRGADSASGRAAAARAQALLARQLGENVEQLVGALGEADGRVEGKVAKAALADTYGRDKAIAVITALLEQGVPADAATGLTQALAALAQDRDQELAQETEALLDASVSSKGEVERTIEGNLDGQRRAAEEIAELLASPSMPAESKPGLQRAYDAVVAEHVSSADILSRFSDRLPDSVRSFVEQVVRQAHEDAQGMRENRPAPPNGPPSGTPNGPPSGTPNGAPSGTPGGPPSGTPGGPPERESDQDDNRDSDQDDDRDSDRDDERGSDRDDERGSDQGSQRGSDRGRRGRP